MRPIRFLYMFLQFGLSLLAFGSDAVSCKVTITRVFKNGYGVPKEKKVDQFNIELNATELSKEISYSVHNITVSVDRVSADSEMTVKVKDVHMRDEILVTEFSLRADSPFTNKVFKFFDDFEMYAPSLISCKFKADVASNKPAVNNRRELKLTGPAIPYAEPHDAERDAQEGAGPVR